MFRTVLAASIFSVTATALLACSGDYSGRSSSTISPLGTSEATSALRVSPGLKPIDVPTGAMPVTQTSALGEITRRAEATPETTALRTLTEGRCINDILTIRTSLETIYASLTCDLFSEDQFSQYFAGRKAALVLEVAPEHYRILIETIEGAQAQFTPSAIWVEE